MHFNCVINYDFIIKQILYFLYYFQIILNHLCNQIFINMIFTINIIDNYLLRIILYFVNNFYNSNYHYKNYLSC